MPQARARSGLSAIARICRPIGRVQQRNGAIAAARSRRRRDGQQHLTPNSRPHRDMERLLVVADEA
jgi:hypothetical protein